MEEMQADSVSEELERWFWSQLDASECAPVKRFYVKVEVITSGEASELCRLLWMCRIIAADKRVTWENISNSFTESFRHPVDLWNEQLAVKLLRTRLEHVDNLADVLELTNELHKHIAAVLKPLPVHGPPCTKAEEHRNSSAASPYRIVPATIEREGSIVCNDSLEFFGELLRVPREDMFFVDTVIVFCDLGRVVHASAELTDMVGGEEQLLVLALIYERFVAKSSHWHKLLLACPSEFPTVPAYWGWDDLSGLYGLDVLDDVIAKQERLRQFHAEVNGVLPRIYDSLAGCSGLERADFMRCFAIENIMWARAVFDSRAFNLNVDGRVVLALVPRADMVNHSNRADVLVRKVEPRGGDFVMQIGASITKEDVGRELWMSYGPLQNWELLQHYGFVLEDNEHDKLPFPLDVSANGVETFPSTSVATAADFHTMNEEGEVQEWDKRRSALVEKYWLHLAGSCWIGYNGVPPPALVALLRVHLAKAEEFNILERHGPFTSVGHDTEAEIIALIAETVTCIIGLPLRSRDATGSTKGLSEGSVDSHETIEETAEEGTADQRNATLCQVLRKGLERIANRTLEWCTAQTTLPLVK